MFRITDFESFMEDSGNFKEKGELLGVSIMTPLQTILAESTVVSIFDPIKGVFNVFHEDIVFYILANLYGFTKNYNVLDREEKAAIKRVIEAKIPNLTKNFIYTRFITNEEETTCTIDIPRIITKRQYSDLLELSEKLKKVSIAPEVAIIGFNPYTREEEWGEICFNSDENHTQLDKALIWLEDNKAIIDYDLPFRKETILGEKRISL